MQSVLGIFNSNNNRFYEENSSDEEISWDEKTEYDYERLPCRKEMRKVQKEISKPTNRSNRRSLLNEINVQNSAQVVLKHHAKNLNMVSLIKESYKIYSSTTTPIIIDEHMLAQYFPDIDPDNTPDFIFEMDQKEQNIHLKVEEDYKKDFDSNPLNTPQMTKNLKTGIYSSFSVAFGALTGIASQKIVKAIKSTNNKRDMNPFIKFACMTGLIVGGTTVFSIGSLYTAVLWDKSRDSVRKKLFESEYIPLEFHNRCIRLQKKIDKIDRVLAENSLSSPQVIQNVQRIRDYFDKNLTLYLRIKETIENDLEEKQNTFEKVNPQLFTGVKHFPLRYIPTQEKSAYVHFQKH